MTKNGILCEVDDKRVYLDPKNGDINGVNFVSHAHSDHLPSKNGGTILSSIETNEIANLRGFKMENHVDSLDDFSLIDSGHILVVSPTITFWLFVVVHFKSQPPSFTLATERSGCLSCIGIPLAVPFTPRLRAHLSERLSAVASGLRAGL